MLTVGIKTGSLQQSIKQEIDAAAKSNHEIKIVASKKALSDSIKSVGGEKGITANIRVNQNVLRKSINDVLANYTPSKAAQIKVKIDEAYIQTQVNNALKNMGKFVQNAQTGTGSSGKGGGDKAITHIQENQAIKEQIVLENKLNQAQSKNYTDGKAVKYYTEAKQAVDALNDSIQKGKEIEATQFRNEMSDIGLMKTRAQNASKEFILSPQSVEQAKALKTTYNEISNIQKDLGAMRTGKGQGFYSGLQEQEKLAQDLAVRLKNGKVTNEDYARSIENIKAAHAGYVKEGKEAGYYADSFNNKLQRFKQHLTTITSIVRAFQMLRMVIQPVVNAVTEVDTAMTQLQIVTRATDAELQNYSNDIMNVADRTAGSVKDLINSTTTFSRLGYSLEESTNLAEYTQMLENVGAIDESTATSAITAIVKAFNVGADDLESVMDKMVTVGNNFPISVSEIAEGMNNAGSMMAMATGGDLDQSIAMLTAANTTIQNISKSSTGLRTIAARIRNVKADLDDLGETMTEVEYDEIVKTITRNGVSLTDENGELRNTYDILSDLSQVWKTLSENEQAALAKTLSGTRQQNKVLKH